MKDRTDKSHSSPYSLTHEVDNFDTHHRSSEDPLRMIPSEQMNYVLELWSRDYRVEGIIQKFYGDEHLVKLLLTSLQSFGLLAKDGNSLVMTEKGKSRLTTRRPPSTPAGQTGAYANLMKISL